MLALDGVTAGYHYPTGIINDITLSVGAGQVVAVIGPNGAGKSTLLGTISGLLKPWSGRIELDGRQIGAYSPVAVVKAGIAQVPEGRRILPGLTVYENLAMGGYALPRRDVRAQLDHVLRLFPLLEQRGRQLGGTLSGGEQQMLAIGRALMSRPQVLLLDEPSMGLAPKIVDTVFEYIAKVRDEGLGVLLVEQNANLALHASSFTHVLERGRVVLAGPSADVQNDRGVQAAYLSTA